MHPELLIRPSVNDHKVVADLLAPLGPGVGRPLSRLVLSAQDAARNSDFRDLAAKSGTPVLIDPMTVLFQGEVAGDDPWVADVSFGRAEAYSAEELANPFILDAIAAQSLEFQVDHGATAIIPPYFYADRPESPSFAASLAAIVRTAKRMRSEGISLPLVPILCAQLQGFAHRPGWQAALDRFASAAIDVGPQALGLFLSPVGNGDESYSKVLDLLVAGRHVANLGVPVLAWRQGTYGPALVAAGLAGYECGMGIGESSNARGYLNQHKPRETKGSRFSAQGTYLPALGRSVPPKIARILLSDRALRGRLVCSDVRCCPRGAESMLASKGRLHAVRARDRYLRELAEIPDPGWRLHHVARAAASARVLATKANELLARARVPNRVHPEGYAALEQAAELLRTRGPAGARDSA
jgi:hypothetical protein